jgi:hypothetical protein
MCVAKLMDGTVDNLMDNSSSCLQVATQGAHDFSHDGLVQLQQQNLYILFLNKTVLTKGSTSLSPQRPFQKTEKGSSKGGQRDC